MITYTYNDLITEQGFLTEQGKTLIKDSFLPTAQNFLSIGKNDNEIRIISSVLSNIIGKTATDLIQFRSHQEPLTQPTNLIDPFDNNPPKETTKLSTERDYQKYIDDIFKDLMNKSKLKE